MSLADHIRLLRAQQAGMGYEALSARLDADMVKQVFQLERKQRDVVDDAMLEKLAAAFQVPVDELRHSQTYSRKALAAFCTEAKASAAPITLHLRHGESLIGRVLWLDMAAIGLQCDRRTLVVQRHAVVEWAANSGDAAEQC